MKIVFDNSTIECLSAEIISRRIDPSSYVEIEKVGRCFTYKCSRNSEATIIKELNPKEALYNKNSLLDIDTVLECENMLVAVNKKKPYQYSKITHSGRHNAQTFTSKEYTMAKISKQIPGIPAKIPPIRIEPIKSVIKE